MINRMQQNHHDLQQLQETQFLILRALLQTFLILDAPLLILDESLLSLKAQFKQQQQLLLDRVTVLSSTPKQQQFYDSLANDLLVSCGPLAVFITMCTTFCNCRSTDPSK